MVSSKQWRDLVEVLRVSARDLDERHLSGWAVRLGVEDLLSNAHAEAESFGASSR